MDYIPQLPSRVLVQRHALEKMPQIAKLFGKNPVVVADAITQGIGGKSIADALGCGLVLVDNSTMENVGKIQAQDTDCIIAFGGGKVIDVAKLAAHKKSVPFVSCPTACSHDGIASRNASITVNGQSASFEASSPSAVVADIDILLKSPYRLTASGAADILSNYCAVHDWKLAKENGEEFSHGFANLSLMAADMVSSSSSKIKSLEEEGIKNLVWSLIFSGVSMSLHGSSRPASGAEHMFSHALDKMGRFGLHGEQVGIGTIFFSYLQGQNWEKIKNTLENLGAPTTIKQVGIPEEVFVDALLKAKDIRKRYTILDEKPLNREMTTRIARDLRLL